MKSTGTRAGSARFKAVIFDLGGVVFSSPLDAFRAYEARNGLPHRFLGEVIVSNGEHGAWSRLERGEVTHDEFARAFEAECAAAGATIRASEIFETIRASSEPRPNMLGAIRSIRSRGLSTAALTNNWRDPSGDRGAAGHQRLGGVFDVVVESAIEGLRKPDPRIYQLVCSRLSVAPHQTVFLDDIGANLKPARAMGMATIKVGDPALAIAELADTLGFALTD